MRNHVLLAALFYLLINAPLFSQSNCNTDVSIKSTFTSQGSPLNGPYQPGELVTFCFNIDGFQQTDCNWLHGLVPEFGDGWDPSSFYSSGQPKNISFPLQAHTNGFWVWFPNNWVSYKATSSTKNLSAGDPAGAGWFFQNFAQPSINPFDPNFTRGDGTDCSDGGNTWEVCFSLITKELYDCPDVVDCSVAFTTFGDGETGSYGTPGCTDDGQIAFSAILDCCDAAVVDPIGDIFICNNESINIPLTSDGDPNAEYSWTVETFNLTGATAGSGNVIQNQLSLINEGIPTFAIYTVFATVDNCTGPVETFQVNISNLEVELGDDIYLCPGEQVRIGEFPVGGASPYTYNWAHGPTNYRPQVKPDETTIYYITVTDAFGCSTTDDITVYIGQAGPIDGPTDLCGLTFGTYSIPPFPGSSSYTWTVPSGAIILSGQGTREIRVNWALSEGGNLCVKPTGGCVSGLTYNCIEVVAGGSFNVGDIFGNEYPCPNSNESYTLSSSDPNADFSWTIEGGEIVSGQGTNVITVNWNDTERNSPRGDIYVTVSNACASYDKSNAVSVDWGAGFAVTGPFDICPGEIAQYDATVWFGTVNQIEWTVTPGASILSGQGTFNVVVDWGTSFDPYLNLTIYGDCVAHAEGGPLNLFLEDDVDLIGPNMVCAGEDVTYEITEELPAGASITWSYPNNFQPLSDPNSEAFSGSWVNDDDGEISASINACGSIFERSMAVTANAGVVTDTVIILCPGLCTVVGGETFCQPGAFTITDNTGGNCGDVINLYFFHLDFNDVMADAGADTNVGCTIATVLTAAASSYPPNSAVSWIDAQGVVIGNEATQEVSEAGIYTLRIFDALTLCEDMDEVEVFPSAPPTADAGPDLWLNCFTNFQIRLESVENPNWNYSWTGPNGFTSNQARPIVASPGDYLLEVTDITTGCGSANDMVTVFDGFELSIDFTQSICNNFDGTATVTSFGIGTPTYAWSNGGNTATIGSLEPGTYNVTVGSEEGTCEEVLTVEVTADLSCKVVIAGNVFDDGENGDCDPEDQMLVAAADIPITIMPLNQTVLTDANGYYEFIVDTGGYTLTAEVPEPYFVLCPGFQTLDVYLNDTSAVSDDNHFFLDYLTNFDLTITAYSTGATAGGDQKIQTQYCNYFFQTINGRIELIHDPLVTFDPVANGADFYDPETYTASWLFASLSWFDCEWLNFNVQIPGDLPDGTVVEHTIIGRPLLGDLQPGNNVKVITRTVVNTSAPQQYVAPIIPQATGQDITVFPNPTHDRFVVQSGEKGNDILAVEMHDIMGRSLLLQENEEGEKKITVNIPQGIIPGVYLLEINTTNGKIGRKLVIE